MFAKKKQIPTINEPSSTTTSWPFLFFPCPSFFSSCVWQQTNRLNVRQKKTKLARTSRQKRKHLLGRSMKNANQTLAASIKKGGAVKENHGNQVSSVCLSFTSVTPSNRRKSITDSVRKKVALFSSDAINNPCRWVFFCAQAKWFPKFRRVVSRQSITGAGCCFFLSAEPSWFQGP